MRSRFCLILLAAATISVLYSCTDFKEIDMPDGLSVDKKEMAFSNGSDSQSVKVTSGSRWDVNSKPEWISLQSINRSGQTPYEWTVNFNAAANDDYNREGVIVFKTNSETVDVAVTQDGKKGKYVPVDAVSLSLTELTLTEGETSTLTYTIKPSNASVKEVSWESSSPSVVTVSQDGKVEAIAEGTALITVTTKDGEKKATCSITVLNRPQSNRIIYYTSSDGNVVTPTSNAAFGANIVSNKYIDGRGVITFDKAVTYIGDSAFSRCGGLTSISLPNGVTGIGAGAFADCTHLTSISIPDGVTSIGAGAFVDCFELKTVIIPEGVITISNNAFSCCWGLTSVYFPNSVTSIGEGAFCDCYALTSVCFPENLTSIGSLAFGSCNKLTTVTIPASVTSIGDRAFSHCSELTSVTIPNSTIQIDYQAFSDCTLLHEFNSPLASNDNRCLIINGLLVGFAPYGLTSYDIPSSVSSIGRGAFIHCSNLTSVTIPKSVNSIGIGAFCGSGLTSIEIPNNVTQIGVQAFQDCRQLISVTIPDSITSIWADVFNGCSKLTSVMIPGSVTSIRTTAFKGCTSLTSITIPESVTELGNGVFSDCTGLTSLTIPKSITELSSGVFSGCTGLTTITIPDSVTSIRYMAFSGCSRLTSLTIPDSVTLIGKWAFWHCSGLQSLVIKSANPPTLSLEMYASGDPAPFEDTNDCPIYVPAGSLDAYKTAWSAYADRLFPIQQGT